MRFGVVGTFGSARQVVDMAVAAEDAGWDGFFTWDGISVGAVDTFDPWALLGAVAVRTSRVTLGAMVFALARRRPWKLAREALTVDHLSGGRLVLPVGLGAVDDGGFARVSGDGVDRRQRARRLDECLDILEAAWTGQPVTYEGAAYQVRDLVFAPRPVRGRIPVWVVAAHPSARSMGRAARWDGMIPTRAGGSMDPLTPAEVRAAAAWPGAARPGFEVVCEGVSSDDLELAGRQVAPLRDAGATWWIESRWQGADPRELLRRIRQGPPRLPG